uniref:Glycosyl transferase n=1 Tax=Chlorobium chlorochromatii (strain CaD3) TaxID=340177 RepID=Q3AQJ7_CHLCH
MNILFMNSARTWGGTEKWTHMAAESLAHEHKVALVYRKNVVGDRFTTSKFQLPCLSHVDVYTLYQLTRIIRQEKIEVIIPTKRKDYLLAGIASRICGISNILRLGIVRPLKLPIIHKLMYHSLVDAVIVNAQQIKTTLLQSPFMVADKIYVIRNGLDTTQLNKKSQPIAPKIFDFQISTVGILTKRKGHDFLLRGFAQFINQEPNANAGIVIIGDGVLKNELQELVEKLHLTQHVHFTGFVENPYPLMAASDVIAMLSTNEGISNALLEGMYLENVPISTFVGGTTEFIQDGKNGFLIDYGNENKLATTLLTIYNNNILKENISLAAKSTILTQFSLTRMTQTLTQLCKTTIKNKAAQHAAYN